MHSGDIELALATHINERQNLIVPNVFWGLGFKYELDMMVVTQNKYAWEIEIKITKSDLKADLKKKHGHYSNRIKRLYFAVPEELKDEALKLIPERAGLFIVNKPGFYTCNGRRIYKPQVELIKAPKINMNARKLNDEEILKLYQLAAMRIWSLKRCIYNLQKQTPSREE
jgi:hypothetical protein